MVITRSSGVAEQEPLPQARAVRGRGLGRGRGGSCTATTTPARAAVVEPHVAPVEQVHDYVEPELPAQVPKAYLFRQLFMMP